MKNIRVSDELHKRISRFGRFGEQYQDIISRAIDALEREEQQESSLLSKKSGSSSSNKK